MKKENIYNEIDFIKYPIFQFNKDSKKKSIKIIKDDDIWEVEYSKHGALNSFDYKLFLYTINKLFQLDTDNVNIRLSDIIKDLNLARSKRAYERIYTALLKLHTTHISTKNTRYNKSNKKFVKETNFYIVPKFSKISDKERDREYQVSIEPLILNNMRNNYHIFHNNIYKFPASNQLLYYLLYHRHSNKRLLLGYDKICELLQLEQRKQKSLITQQLDKYFDEIIETGEIKSYSLYKNKHGKFIYKIIYNTTKKKAPTTKPTKTIEIKKPAIEAMEKLTEKFAQLSLAGRKKVVQKIKSNPDNINMFKYTKYQDTRKRLLIELINKELIKN